MSTSKKTPISDPEAPPREAPPSVDDLLDASDWTGRLNEARARRAEALARSGRGQRAPEPGAPWGAAEPSPEAPRLVDEFSDPLPRRRKAPPVGSGAAAEGARTAPGTRPSAVVVPVAAWVRPPETAAGAVAAPSDEVPWAGEGSQDAAPASDAQALSRAMAERRARRRARGTAGATPAADPAAAPASSPRQAPDAPDAAPASAGAGPAPAESTPSARSRIGLLAASVAVPILALAGWAVLSGEVRPALDLQRPAVEAAGASGPVLAREGTDPAPPPGVFPPPDGAGPASGVAGGDGARAALGDGPGGVPVAVGEPAPMTPGRAGAPAALGDGPGPEGGPVAASDTAPRSQAGAGGDAPAAAGDGAEVGPIAASEPAAIPQGVAAGNGVRADLGDRPGSEGAPLAAGAPAPMTPGGAAGGGAAAAFGDGPGSEGAPLAAGAPAPMTPAGDGAPAAPGEGPGSEGGPVAAIDRAAMPQGAADVTEADLAGPQRPRGGGAPVVSRPGPALYPQDRPVGAVDAPEPAARIAAPGDGPRPVTPRSGDRSPGRPLAADAGPSLARAAGRPDATAPLDVAAAGSAPPDRPSPVAVEPRRGVSGAEGAGPGGPAPVAGPARPLRRDPGLAALARDRFPASVPSRGLATIADVLPQREAVRPDAGSAPVLRAETAPRFATGAAAVSRPAPDPAATLVADAGGIPSGTGSLPGRTAVPAEIAPRGTEPAPRGAVAYGANEPTLAALELPEGRPGASVAGPGTPAVAPAAPADAAAPGRLRRLGPVPASDHAPLAARGTARPAASPPDAVVQAPSARPDADADPDPAASAVPGVEELERLLSLDAAPGAIAPETRLGTATDAPQGAATVPAAYAGVLVWVHGPESVGAEGIADAAEALAAMGIDATTAAPVSFAISRDQLRYFYPADRAAADGIAALTGAEPRDFTDYRPLPAEGTLELWLKGTAVASSRAAPTVEGARAASPARSAGPAPEWVLVQRGPGILDRLIGNPAASVPGRGDLRATRQATGLGDLFVDRMVRNSAGRAPVGSAGGSSPASGGSPSGSSTDAGGSAGADSGAPSGGVGGDTGGDTGGGSGGDTGGGSGGDTGGGSGASSGGGGSTGDQAGGKADKPGKDKADKDKGGKDKGGKDKADKDKGGKDKGGKG